MKKSIAIIAFSLLAGCASFSTSNTIDTKSAANRVYAAKVGYTAVLTAAVTYNNLPRCGAPTSPPVCSQASVVDQLRKANSAAVATLDSAETVVRTPNVNQDVVEFSVVSAENAVKTVQSIVKVYNIK
jgi:hypothetical protein